MARILVIYGTTEGHTRKIAETVANWLTEWGHAVVAADTASPTLDVEPKMFDAVIAAGSLHVEKHQSALTHYVRHHAAALNQMPGAFLSVSLSAIIDDDDHRKDVKKCMDAFLEETGWKPTQTQAVAGALKYSHYDFFKKALLRSIAKKNGYSTDPSKDYEYTDWNKLRSFIDSFAQLL